MRFVAGLFLAAHGLVHLLYLAPRPPDDPNYPFVPETRWLPAVLGMAPPAARRLAGILAALTAIAFAVAGVAVLAEAEVWTNAAIVASGISLALLLGFFHPWLLLGIAIDVAVVVAAVR